ncbi:MAG: hypothetical protein KDB27_27845, partial [Planctomycetales bacterium]|nr:hypothetical protein [Planctomycetales bacterium]
MNRRFPRVRANSVRNLEVLENRCLLAGDLVANWQAQSLVGGMADGDKVTAWMDSVGSIEATSQRGEPTLVEGQFSGKAVVRFNNSDGIDQLFVADSDSPISGATDFSVTVAFATNSSDLT